MLKSRYVASKILVNPLNVANLPKNHGSGLTLREVKKQQQIHGSNYLPLLGKKSYFSFMLDYSRSIVYLVLLLATVLLWQTPFYPLSIVSIISLISLSVVLGCKLHQVNTQIALFDTILKDDYLVIRDGLDRRVKGTELVVGDLILLGAGDFIPANVCFLNPDQVILDRDTSIFGTRVLTGEGLAVVTTIGIKLVQPAKPELVAQSRVGTFFTLVQKLRAAFQNDNRQIKNTLTTKNQNTSFGVENQSKDIAQLITLTQKSQVLSLNHRSQLHLALTYESSRTNDGNSILDNRPR